MEKIFMISYFIKLTPNEKIKLGYISWNDNFRIRHGECSFLEKYFLLFLSFLRFLFSCPISFDGGVKKIRNLKLNISQLDSDEYYKVKDRL